ncbi:site-specific integrase [Solwaraspora sp. WMMD1047]|uniref:site-specific integrase n=1 Tax=Solwaraspora sp. WMMD1047 TaxID=3016102 RepID=UPI0024169B7D|nr:site-specific integrase [Solwaraspora sp. WMMD1047]MDG4834123.1 site-specific integrase [Solwaraspora sp. WMMD1047]
MSRRLELLPAAQTGRVFRDRLEVLTALLQAPTSDPLYHRDVIDFPRDHPVYAWGCGVTGCERPRQWIAGAGLCQTHYTDWLAARRNGMSRAAFLDTATPLTGKGGFLTPCRICPGRPAATRASDLCRRHRDAWQRSRDDTTFEEWLPAQVTFDGYGTCAVVVCPGLAEGPLGLCAGHRENYHDQGRPGGASLPVNWLHRFESRGLPVVVGYQDEAAFREWCRTTRALRHLGEISLLGLRPLTKAELQWGLHAHARRREHTHWAVGWIRALVHLCRSNDVRSLAEVDLASCSHTDRMIVQEILDHLRLVYHGPQDTKAAGFIEAEHFGRRFDQTKSHFDLTDVSLRWLRDLLWDRMASLLLSPQCPRTRKVFDGLHRSCVELAAFLAVDAPAGGHDPTLLGAEHAHRFAADYRHREREVLPALAVRRKDGQLSTVTEHTRRDVFNYARRTLYEALESGEAARIGLSAAFITAIPHGGGSPRISRNPFTDEVAQALADETNLARLAADHDPLDRGVRDVWETIVFTGRRCSEVLKLRLDCIGHYGGLAMLWHDQTKVGNYNAGIRIPERLYQRLDGRRRTSLIRFEHRHARQPTRDERASMALFPSGKRNPGEARSIAYTTFHNRFKAWVDGLDLGSCVPHQARHTLATKLLKHGATLSHIRQYLGQVSERMAEHYTKIAATDLDDILHAVWVAGPGAANPGELLSSATAPLDRNEALALALDLSRRSTPADGGFCTFQPVVDGGACPWKLDCENCDRFVLSGADLLYWRRKQEQWRSIAERAPDDATADYLHQVFAPTAQAIHGLEKALAGLGLLDQALALDLRRPQDYYHRIWNVGFRAADLADITAQPPPDTY